MGLHDVAVHLLHPAALEVYADTLVVEKGDISDVHLAPYKSMPFPLHPLFEVLVLARFVTGVMYEHHNQNGKSSDETSSSMVVITGAGGSPFGSRVFGSDGRLPSRTSFAVQ